MSEQTDNQRDDAQIEMHAQNEQKCPMSLDEVNLFVPGSQPTWHESYKFLHNEAPVHRIPGEGLAPGADAFILSKYEDIAQVVRDPARFPPPRYTVAPKLEGDDSDGSAMKDIVFSPQMNAMQVSMASLRPNMDLWKSHKRELTDPWVGAGASRHTKMVTDTVDGLIDEWIDEKGSIDFVERFSRPLPQIVMTTNLGFPVEDIPQLAAWGSEQVRRYVHGHGHRNLLTAAEEAEQVQVLSEFADYVLDHVKAKRANPKEDMISWLTQVTYKALDRKLTDIEIVGIVYAMQLGGLETTQYAIAEQARLLCENPQVFADLKANPDKIKLFNEEVLRLRAPTQGLSTRMTSQDEVFQGVQVPAGSLLHLRWGAANLDPETFECPRQIDLERKPITRHLTFSQGPRTCPGNGISRLEQAIAWERLLPRLDSLSYAAENDFEYQPGIMMGLYSLNVDFTKAG